MGVQGRGRGTKKWDLRIRFLVKAEDAVEAWTRLYNKLPDVDDVLIAYDSVVPAKEYVSQSLSRKVKM